MLRQENYVSACPDSKSLAFKGLVAGLSSRHATYVLDPSGTVD